MPPRRGLVFSRKHRQHDAESTMSIRKLRELGLPGETLSVRSLQGIYFTEDLGACPEMTPQMKYDAHRKDFWYIRNNHTSDSYLSILGAMLTPYSLSLVTQRNKLFIQKEENGVSYEVIARDDQLLRVLIDKEFLAQRGIDLSLLEAINEPLDRERLQPLLDIILQMASQAKQTFPENKYSFVIGKISTKEVYLEKQADRFFYEMVTPKNRLVREEIGIADFKKTQASEVVSLLDQIAEPLDHPRLKPLLFAVLEDGGKKGYILTKADEIAARLMSLTDHLPTQWLLLSLFEQRILTAVKNTEATNHFSGFLPTAECSDPEKAFIRSDRIKTGYCVQDVLDEAGNRTGVRVEELTFVFGCVVNGSHAQIEEGCPSLTYVTQFFLSPRSPTEVFVRVEGDYTVMQSPSVLTSFLMSQHPTFLGRAIDRASAPLSALEVLWGFEKNIFSGMARDAISAEPPDGCCREHQDSKLGLIRALRESSFEDLRVVYNQISLYRFARAIVDTTREFLGTLCNVRSDSEAQRVAYRTLQTDFCKLNPEDQLTRVRNYLSATTETGWLFWSSFLLLPLSAAAGERSLQRDFLLHLCEKPAIRAVLLPDQQGDLGELSEAVWSACRERLLLMIRDIKQMHQPAYLPVLTPYIQSEDLFRIGLKVSKTGGARF